MKHALDTNTLIYFLKGMGRVAGNLLSHAPTDILIPAVVLYEIETGIAKSNAPEMRRRQLAALLTVVSVAPFDERCASAAATVRANLERSGTGIGAMDTLIAGTALANGAALVTHHIREFSRVPGLVLVDWFDSGAAASSQTTG